MGPSLILDGLLVRVSGECPTAISSLDEGECESGVSGDPGLGQRITQTLHTCALRNLGEEVCSLGGCPLTLAVGLFLQRNLRKLCILFFSALLDTPTILGIAAEKFD